MSEIKGTFEELEAIVTDLHRSAAQLDELIQTFNELNPEDVKYIEFFAAQQARYRADFKRHRSYDQLEEREKLIWQKLIENLKTEKES